MNRKIAVLVSGRGSNMEYLLKASAEGRLKNTEVKLVIASRPGIEAVKRAAGYDAVCITVDRRLYNTDDDYSLELYKIFREEEIEIICLAGFLHRIGAVILDRYKDKVINIHPSLLPSFGGREMYGMRVHKEVIARGAKKSGCTVHIAGAGYDTGRIILQKEVPVLADDTPEQLAARVLMEEGEAYVEALNMQFSE